MRTIHSPEEAARILAEGGLVALPTETVYGLGARADQPLAVAKVYAAKGRPADHPVIVHLASTLAMPAWTDAIPEYARALADAFWPGPMTLVLARSAKARDFITGGQDTVGLRVPEHPQFLATLAELAALTGDVAIGIAAPSANRFGRVSPTTALHVLDEFSDVLDDAAAVLEGGAANVGVESTIVDCTNDAPVILRAGAITKADIERVTGRRVEAHSSVRAPGTLAAHYAPRARVIIATASAEHDACGRELSEGRSVGLLALAAVPTPQGVVRLSAPPDSARYAAALYAALREADALELDTIVAVPPTGGSGLEPAILDRLTRAAHQ